ncbi:hypothetical protein RFI_11007 [Reticulomyxa filosa]|uniref:Globin domain-containing protein n=1 Tax=Reticulomyxa filosa TaxID=46433 RepID=X6NJF6_RETFI|nr:hypothetical protein RFI_11007 [Reticulomyxa filosa]|eukprot:ETO26131.1 hypothetical protein RFI_11007 [Reticulomyxa filosa]
MVQQLGGVIHFAEDEHFPQILREIGAKHYEFQIQPKHFVVGKKAFLQMLQSMLGVMWDGTAQRAWSRTWDYMSAVMCRALKESWMLHLPSEPAEIKCDLTFEHIKSINWLEGNFYADVHYNFYNGGIPSEASAFSTSNPNFSLEKITHPPWFVELLNEDEATDYYNVHNMPQVTYVSDTKDAIFQRGQVSGTFNQFFDLKKYPFDAHRLRLYFQLNVDRQYARFDKEHIKVSIAPMSKLLGLGGTDWDICTPICHFESRKINYKKHQMLVVSVPIRRRFGNFIYQENLKKRKINTLKVVKFFFFPFQVLFPLFLVDSVALQAYFVEAHPVFYRMSLLVPLLLTLFTFKWTLSNQFPPVPYLMVMDHFFLQSYFIFFLHTMISVVIFLLERNGTYRQFYNYLFFITVFFVYLGMRLSLLLSCLQKIEYGKRNCRNEHAQNSLIQMFIMNYGDIYPKDTQNFQKLQRKNSFSEPSKSDGPSASVSNNRNSQNKEVSVTNTYTDIEKPATLN